MRKRTKAREFALQLLYQREFGDGQNGDTREQDFWREVDTQGMQKKDLDEIKSYANALVQSVLEHKDEIDRKIESSAEHWRMARMALVDRNILRLGVCEILFNKEIPLKVAINEAIELAKLFGDADSSKFVNGILDKIAKDSGKT